jgi:hypothetical protein
MTSICAKNSPTPQLASSDLLANINTIPFHRESGQGSILVHRLKDCTDALDKFFAADYSFIASSSEG